MARRFSSLERTVYVGSRFREPCAPRPPEAAEKDQKKLAEPVALSSTQPSDFWLPPTVLRFSFDLLALRARRNRQPIGLSRPRARGSATKICALCEVGKFGREELVAKSEDQVSSESPCRRRQSHTAPPSVASPAATAFVGRPEPFVVADFALLFATRLLTFQTAHPRTAFRLFSTAMWRGYPTASVLTHSRTPPPSGALWREG
jgi:hypothetical protein